MVSRFLREGGFFITIFNEEVLKVPLIIFDPQKKAMILSKQVEIVDILSSLINRLKTYGQWTKI